MTGQQAWWALRLSRRSTISFALSIACVVVFFAQQRSGADAPRPSVTTTRQIAFVGKISPLSPARRAVNTLKVMNYFPAGTPWASWWQHYNHTVVDKDFASIASLGANTVRIVVQPSGVGWPVPTTSGAAVLSDAISTAAAHGLSVQLTLFDWWNGYAQVNASIVWMNALLSPYRNDKRIVLVEPQNELPISNPVAVSWAKAVLARLTAVLPGVPRTVSVAGDQGAAEMREVTQDFGRSLLDVLDTHLYGSQNAILAKLAAVRSVAAGRPVFVGELGQSTFGANPSCMAQAQLEFYQRAALLIAASGISAVAPWTFTDFTPGSLRASTATAAESDFGIRTAFGAFKPSAAAIRTMFAAPSASARLATLKMTDVAKAFSFDGGFNCDLHSPSDNSGNDAWTVFDSHGAARAGAVSGAGLNGSPAGFLSATTGNPEVTVPALMRAFPVLSGRTVTASAYTRLVHATGVTTVALAWFRGSTYLGHTQSLPAANNTTRWQHLTVSSAPPAGATTFGLYLNSASNSGTAYFDSAAVKN